MIKILCNFKNIKFIIKNIKMINKFTYLTFNDILFFIYLIQIKAKF